MRLLGFGERSGASPRRSAATAHRCAIIWRGNPSPLQASPYVDVSGSHHAANLHRRSRKESRIQQWVASLAASVTATHMAAAAGEIAPVCSGPGGTVSQAHRGVQGFGQEPPVERASVCANSTDRQHANDKYLQYPTSHVTSLRVRPRKRRKRVHKTAPLRKIPPYPIGVNFMEPALIILGGYHPPPSPSHRGRGTVKPSPLAGEGRVRG